MERLVADPRQKAHNLPLQRPHGDQTVGEDADRKRRHISVFRVLSKFAGGLLEGSNGDPIPLIEKAQMRITAQGSLMAEFRTADRARRNDPLDPKAPSPVATAGSEAPRGWDSSRAPVPESTGTRQDHPLLPPAASR